MTKEFFYKKYSKEKIEETMLLLCDFDLILPEKNKKEYNNNVLNTIKLLDDLIQHIKKLYKK